MSIDRILEAELRVEPKTEDIDGSVSVRKMIYKISVLLMLYFIKKETLYYRFGINKIVIMIITVGLL